MSKLHYFGNDVCSLLGTYLTPDKVAGILNDIEKYIETGDKNTAKDMLQDVKNAMKGTWSAHNLWIAEVPEDEEEQYIDAILSDIFPQGVPTVSPDVIEGMYLRGFTRSKADDLLFDYWMTR